MKHLDEIILFLVTAIIMNIVFNRVMGIGYMTGFNDALHSRKWVIRDANVFDFPVKRSNADMEAMTNEITA